MVLREAEILNQGKKILEETYILSVLINFCRKNLFSDRLNKVSSKKTHSHLGCIEFSQRKTIFSQAEWGFFPQKKSTMNVQFMCGEGVYWYKELIDLQRNCYQDIRINFSLTRNHEITTRCASKPPFKALQMRFTYTNLRYL